MKSPSKSIPTKQKHPRKKDKFIPNLSQLQETAKNLPDPDKWPEERYRILIEADNKQRSVEFEKRSINRGEKKTSRWIFEGKVLIRNRDIEKCQKDTSSS
ncbi:MAG: hypothetical protein AAF065_12470 [Verrucomicrobiota bacterium]